MDNKKPEDIEYCAECPLFRFDTENPKESMKGCNHRDGPGDFVDFDQYATDVHPECPLPIKWHILLGKLPRSYMSKVLLAAGNTCLDITVDTAASYDKDLDDLEIRNGEIAVYARRPKDIADEEFGTIKKEFMDKFVEFAGVTFDSLLLKEIE